MKWNCKCKALSVVSGKYQVLRYRVVKNLPANAGHTGDEGSLPPLGRFPGVGKATHSSILAGKPHG